MHLINWLQSTRIKMLYYANLNGNFNLKKKNIDIVISMSNSSSGLLAFSELNYRIEESANNSNCLKIANL